MSLKETSKYISLILRHKPETIGITLDEHGWANVDELIAGISGTQARKTGCIPGLVRKYAGCRIWFLQVRERCLADLKGSDAIHQTGNLWWERNLIQNKTVLNIAHRMRTIAKANKIVVLKDGVVAEQGSPEALNGYDSIYKRMKAQQTASQNWRM